MSWPIRGQGGHLVFPIGPKNTNLVEGIEILLPVKFRWIPFSGFRGEVENVSTNQRPGRRSCFSDQPEQHKLGRGRWDLAFCQVSLNSVQRFQRRSRKCLSQSEARAAILFFRSARKNTNLVEGVEILLPVKFRWILFRGCNTQFILHGVIRPGVAQCCAKVRRTFWNRTIRQYTSIESLFNRLLRDIIFPQRINFRAGQILPKIVIFFMVNFREARRLYDVIALSQGPRCAIRKFALERAFLHKKIKRSFRVHCPSRLRAPWRRTSTWHFAHKKYAFWESCLPRTQSHITLIFSFHS